MNDVTHSADPFAARLPPERAPLSRLAFNLWWSWQPGAGDVFLAALMVAWLTTGELATPRNLRFAAAGGSLAVEGVGLGGVPSKAAVASRLGRGGAGDRSRS